MKAPRRTASQLLGQQRQNTVFVVCCAAFVLLYVVFFFSLLRQNLWGSSNFGSLTGPARLCSKESCRIVAAGMLRSASTWQYNVIRHLLRRHGFIVKVYSRGQGSNKQLTEFLRRSRHVIVKTHEFDSDLMAAADVIFTSHRDLRDICASCHRFEKPNNESYCVSKMNAYFAHHRKIVTYADYDMKYEAMIEDPMKEMKAISTVLGFPTVSEQMLETIYSDIEKEKTGSPEGWNSITRFRNGHVTSPDNGGIGDYKKELSSELIKEINDQHYAWLKQHNYL